MFTLGTGFSVLEGVSRLMTPSAVESPLLIYAVIAASALFEGVSWFAALRAFRAAKGESGLLGCDRREQGPAPFFVVLV